MKKIFTLVVIALFSLNLSAQKIEKGVWQIEIGTGIEAGFNWVTGGEFDYKTTSNGTVISESDGDWSDFYNSQTNLNYGLDFTNFNNWEDRFLKDISLGYFVADGFLIGLGLNLGGFNTKDDDTTLVVKDGELTLGATPKIRYYIETGRGNAMFFESSFGLRLNNTSNRTDNVLTEDWDETKTNSFGSTIGLGVGWSFFNFNSREIFSVEPMIGFNINSGTTNSTFTTYDKSSDITNIDDKTDKFTSMGPYAKLKLGFYFGRHFWSH
jgi:hypothetical protein